MKHIRDSPHQRKGNDLQVLLGQLVLGGTIHGAARPVDVIPGALHAEIEQIGSLDRREYERGD